MKSEEQAYIYTFAERLKNLRNERSIPQAELAFEIGVSENTIRRFEKAEAVPNLIHLHKLADCFDVPVSYLAGSDINEDYDLMSISNAVEEILHYVKPKPAGNPLLTSPIAEFLYNDFKNKGIF